jgi:hypothetical protein
MKARLLAVAAVIALVMAVFSRGEGPTAGPPPPRVVPSPEATATPGREEPSPRPPPTDESIAVPSRDVFRYADTPSAAPHPLRPVARATPPPAPEPPPPPTPAARLVGLLSKGGTLQAAFSIDGVVWVAGPGEEVGGYTVLSLDEQSGVRLRGPDGGEVVLELPD